MMLDALISITLVLAFIRGWKKGLLWAVASFVAVVLGSLVSLKLAHKLSEYIQEQNIINSQYTLIVSYILLFLIVMLGLRFLIKFVENVLQGMMLGWTNKLSGGILYIFFSAFVLSSMFWITNKLDVISPETKAESMLYETIEPLAPMGLEIGGEVLPVLKDLYNEVSNYLDAYAE